MKKLEKVKVKKVKQPWHTRSPFGSLYVTEGSKYIYIGLTYFNERKRFPSDKEDSAENWKELSDFMKEVGEKIEKQIFCFADAFYWLNEEIKIHFTILEGKVYRPKAEHVLFGDYATSWRETKLKKVTTIGDEKVCKDLLSRGIPYLRDFPFDMITTKVMEGFIDNLKPKYRLDPYKLKENKGQPLSVGRVKNIILPIKKVWQSACDEYSWNLRDPFALTHKYKEISDQANQERGRQAIRNPAIKKKGSTREIFLLEEWQRLLANVDAHYHLAMELMLMGMIGSEMEALKKEHIKKEDKVIHVCCMVMREESDASKKHFMFKVKSKYRERDIPLTNRLNNLITPALASSNSEGFVTFENDITLKANEFVLTMKDGSFFNYRSFCGIWEKAMLEAGLDRRVPYACRHTTVQWSLLIGMERNRLVDLMGHVDKELIYKVYGKYRKGLVEERTRILEYLGEDYLFLEELRTFFPERYFARMAVGEPSNAPGYFNQGIRQSHVDYSNVFFSAGEGI